MKDYYKDSYMELFKSLVKLSKKDIQAARILYDNKQYRNSIFLFQQAVEKANKAFGSFAGDLKQLNDLKKISHRPLLMYKTAINEKTKKMDTLRVHILNEKSATDDLSKYYNSLYLLFSDSVKFIDSLLGKRVINPSIKELQQYLSYIDQTAHFDIQLSPDFEYELPEFMIGLDGIIQSLELDEKTKNQFLVLIRSEEHRKTIVRMFSDMFIPLMTVLPFIIVTFVLCAIITSEHAVLARYPDDNHDPNKLYRKSMPVIKLLPEFMSHLEIALQKLTLLK